MVLPFHLLSNGFTSAKNSGVSAFFNAFTFTILLSFTYISKGTLPPYPVISLPKTVVFITFVPSSSVRIVSTLAVFRESAFVAFRRCPHIFPSLWTAAIISISIQTASIQTCCSFFIINVFKSYSIIISITFCACYSEERYYKGRENICFIALFHLF